MRFLEPLWSAFSSDMSGVVILARDSNIESYIDFFVEGTKIQSEQSMLWVSSRDLKALTQKPFYFFFGGTGLYTISFLDE